jgi:hypothetical protein
MTSAQAQILTLFFLLSVTVLTVGYDLLIIRTAGPDASISRVLGRLLELPSAFVVFVFWLGVLVGHVWLPAR